MSDVNGNEFFNMPEDTPESITLDKGFWRYWILSLDMGESIEVQSCGSYSEWWDILNRGAEMHRSVYIVKSRQMFGHFAMDHDLHKSLSAAFERYRLGEF